MNKTRIQQLDARLQAVADAVRPGSVVADVGTDHGYLICALIASHRCPRGYASDIHSAPLACAQSNIAAQGLCHKITTLLSDGLHALPAEDIDDIVLAGMGGEHIASLLLDVDWTRDAAKRLILQPMTRAEALRRTLYREGFFLLDETAAVSGKFVYSIMTAAYGGAPQEIEDCFAYTGLLLNQQNPAAQTYCRLMITRLQKRLVALQVGRVQDGEVQHLRRLLHQIQEGAAIRVSGW